MLIAGILGAFLFLGVGVFWWHSNAVLLRGASQCDLQRDAAFALNSISDRVRIGSSVTISDFGSQTANLLIVRAFDDTELARFHWDDSDSTIYWSASGGDSSTLVAGSVTDLSFSVTDQEVAATVSLQNELGQTADFSTVTFLRN